MLEVRWLIDPGLELAFEKRDEQLCTLDLNVPRLVIAASLNASQ
jgi:hypothetical protein